jgi:aspartate aminotransferase
MTVAPSPFLDFGDQRALDASLSAMARELRGSLILGIAADVRALAATGRPICNLTVGDFDPQQFPIPVQLKRLIIEALDRGETNYPPSDGLAALRQAVMEFIAREHGVTTSIQSVIITAGGRPAIYAVFRCLLNRGDVVVYPVPSWNNDYYAGMVGARTIAVGTSAEEDFQPTLALLAPHLAEATLLCLCSPANPTGTILPPEALREIMEAVVEENARRTNAGGRPLFVLHDLMYGSLVFREAAHAHPLALVPAAAPWVITVDGISKAFAGTGLRVGWATGAPAVIARMKDFLGHVGAWAPRPEQAATAQFLGDAPAIAAYRAEMDAGLTARLDALHDGFTALRRAGHPVNCIRPQGAIYLSLHLDLVGRRVKGVELTNNEAVRKLLLEQAGIAVVPFDAFGLSEQTGWFRLSAGAVSVKEITEGLERVRTLLEDIGGSQKAN